MLFSLEKVTKNRTKEFIEKIVENTELKLFKHLDGQIKNLSRYIPNTIKMMSLKISCMRYYFGDEKKRTKNVVKSLFDRGIVNAHLCVNAATGVSHTEMDGSYTLISVPMQPNDNWKKMQTKFHFNIKENESIVIPMTEMVCFLFSGFMLSHNQVINDKPESTENDFFLNIATYANKRLCDNMFKSFKR